MTFGDACDHAVTHARATNEPSQSPKILLSNESTANRLGVKSYRWPTPHGEFIQNLPGKRKNRACDEFATNNHIVAQKSLTPTAYTLFGNRAQSSPAGVTSSMSTHRLTFSQKMRHKL
jgi:hypothetical protein